jgi:hypothetical protein
MGRTELDAQFLTEDKYKQKSKNNRKKKKGERGGKGRKMSQVWVR